MSVESDQIAALQGEISRLELRVAILEAEVAKETHLREEAEARISTARTLAIEEAAAVCDSQQDGQAATYHDVCNCADAVRALAITQAG